MESTEENSNVDLSIFDAIGRGDLEEFKRYLAQHKGNVNFFDENGMTALQHAAFKGSKEMVQLLLDRGADVHSGNHEYNYTALHFGALSGNSDVCKLLLNAGAKPTMKNSVGRTASEMGAFVGNHLTVATINNFIPQSEIAYYSILQGQQTEPTLPPFLVDPLHKFILGVDIHPIRLALNLQHLPGLLEHADKVSEVLELMCKKEISSLRHNSEILSFKYHYLSYIVRQFNNISNKQKNSSKDEKKYDDIETFAKNLLKPGKDGYTLVYMDLFLKDCVRQFPFRECTTFRMLVTSLTNREYLPAVTVINNELNGHRCSVDPLPSCSTCGVEKPEKKCSKCKSVQYCDRECQRLHWFVHKKTCKKQPIVTPIAEQTTIDAAEISAELQNLIAG